MTERDRIYRAIRDAIVEYTPWGVHMEDVEQVAAMAAARLEGGGVREIESILSECLHPPLILSDDNAVVVAAWFTERIEKALSLVRRREGARTDDEAPSPYSVETSDE